MRWITFGLLLGLVVGCGAVAEEERAAAPFDLSGEWRAVLASPGGDLPFGLRFEDRGAGLPPDFQISGEGIETGTIAVAVDCRALDQLHH